MAHLVDIGHAFHLPRRGARRRWDVDGSGAGGVGAVYADMRRNGGGGRIAGDWYRGAAILFFVDSAAARCGSVWLPFAFDGLGSWRVGVVYGRFVGNGAIRLPLSLDARSRIRTIGGRGGVGE